MGYRFTYKRRTALKKAALISARKRRRKFSFATAKKVSARHKKAIALVAGGVAIASTTGGVWYYTSSRKRPKQEPPGQAKPPEEQRPQRMAGITPIDLGVGSAPDRTVTREKTLNHELVQYIRASSHPVVKSLMWELHGKPVPGGGKKAKYKIVELSDKEWNIREAYLKEKLDYSRDQ